jgi:DNA-binding transcriptional LysR family regulator
MRYAPVASREYIKRYLPDGFTAQAAAEAPSLAWNRDDALQDMLVRKVFRRDIRRPQHFIPTAEGFGAAVRAGLGWGMFPDSLAAPHLVDGSFVRLSDAHLTCRCVGSAGSSTARSSPASVMQCAQSPPTGTRASRSAMSRDHRGSD